jgi:hypothetical protein
VTEQSQQRVTTFNLHGQQYRVPDYWLAARASAHRQDGRSHREAIHLALEDWALQEDLAKVEGKP